MVSEARRWEKLNRMESKIMAYRLMIDTKTIPETNDVINFHASRWGKPASELELARAVQAINDIRADMEKNVEKMGLSWEDYVNDLHARGAMELYSEFSAKKEAKKKDA